MAQPQNPNSPSSRRDDDEISLDEVDARTQARPRLPDQRREKRQFEVVAPTEREPAQPIPGSAGENVVERLSPDEIDKYDPAVIEIPVPPQTRAPKNEPAAPAKAAQASVAGLDDLEEFIARTATEGPQAESTHRQRRPYSFVEKVCVGSGALVLLALAVWLIRAVASEANAVPPASKPWPALPMEGSLITIKEASANWRPRKESDRVAQMEVILPVPEHRTPDLIPQAVFTIESGSGKAGYLRFIFRDSLGNPRGDTRVVHLENGNLKDMGKGEIITSGSEGSVYCSEGMQSLAAYHSYAADHVPRWSVEIAESADYAASDKDWKVLGTFDVRNQLVK